MNDIESLASIQSEAAMAAVEEVSRAFSFKAPYNSVAFSVFHGSDVYDINDPTRRRGK